MFPGGWSWDQCSSASQFEAISLHPITWCLREENRATTSFVASVEFSKENKQKIKQKTKHDCGEEKKKERNEVLEGKKIIIKKYRNIGTVVALTTFFHFVLSLDVLLLIFPIVGV